MYRMLTNTKSTKIIVPFVMGYIDYIYSAPYEVIPYMEEPFSHHWFTPQPPRFQGLLFIGPPIAHKNIFAQLPKKEANETEQPSPPLHLPKVGGLLSHFDK